MLAFTFATVRGRFNALIFFIFVSMKRSEMLILSETGTEPVSVSEAKAWALIDTSSDDTEIDYLITTARRMVESYINKDILPKQRKYYSPYVTDGVLALPYAPVDTIDSVLVGTTTYTSNQYDVYGAYGAQMDFSSEIEDALVTYTTTGFVPDQQVNEAIKALVQHLYNAQGVIEESDIADGMPKHIKQMLIGQTNRHNAY